MQHNPTKVTFSKDELELVTNAQILLTKNEIIKKVQTLFAVLSEEFVVVAQRKLANDLTKTPPKISRGENYEGLPYVVLDYPRNYKREEIFAIRIFFWWGNFISITLHLSGKYKDSYLPCMNQAIENGRLTNWYISISDDEWLHHFRNNNYEIVTAETAVNEKPFIKVATKIPLKEWDVVEAFLLEKFSFLIELLQA